MKNLKDYKKRFYNLMESTIGDVKPLIAEQEVKTIQDYVEEFKQILLSKNFEMSPDQKKYTCMGGNLEIELNTKNYPIVFKINRPNEDEKTPNNIPLVTPRSFPSNQEDHEMFFQNIILKSLDKYISKYCQIA